MEVRIRENAGESNLEYLEGGVGDISPTYTVLRTGSRRKTKEGSRSAPSPFIPFLGLVIIDDNYSAIPLCIKVFIYYFERLDFLQIVIIVVQQQALFMFGTFHHDVRRNLPNSILNFS